MKFVASILGLSILGMVTVGQAAQIAQKEPKTAWQDKKVFEKNLVDQGYTVTKFKVSGNCYELYGKNKEQKKVEIYFNPVTGEKIKEEIR